MSKAIIHSQTSAILMAGLLAIMVSHVGSTLHTEDSDAALNSKSNGHHCHEARAVLERNWQSATNSTIPSYGLYPHQWSWDSSFIAIGYSGYDSERARAELSSLFRAQWSNGMLPHIVFNPKVPRGAYFPDDIWWKSEEDSLGRCPQGVKTSGIVDPPVHVMAALRVFKAHPSSATLSWLRSLYPSLRSWLDFLHRDRGSSDMGGLVWIRHPWESGMDNAPLWDGPLAALNSVSGCPANTEEPRPWSTSCVIPPFGRQDLAHSDPSMRPSNDTYNKFVYLLLHARNQSYDDSQMIDFPFRVIDVLFNTLLVQANLDLANIASLLGHSQESQQWAHRGDKLREAMEGLWSDQAQLYLNYDLAAGKWIQNRHVGGLAPLMLGTSLGPHRSALLRSVMSSAFSPAGGLAVATSPSDETTFDRRNYWRGPVWVNVDWLLLQGLSPQSAPAEMLVESVRRAVELPGNGGFFEYFDPFTGAHRGTGNFSWTAALYHDTFCTGSNSQSALRSPSVPTMVFA
mmetsp:Transcript_47707/g.137786  ORF Transcript_47707/g.137786 Transcript_47707/m.137786 type:complete len:514 (+) Transcript_47707:77-1618(+)